MSRSSTNIAILLAGLVVGWASALYSIQSLGSTPADERGTWSTWDTGNANELSPYATAHYLLEGQIPPAIGLFRSYYATRDDDGNALDSRCSYRVLAHDNGVRWWSFATGRGLRADDNGASSISSETALGSAQGVELVVAAVPSSGNWLQPPTSGAMEFSFMVAHDSKLGNDDAIVLPSIRREKC